MINELLLLMKKNTDTLIERTKTKPQETLGFKLKKQLQTFSFNPPINLSEEGKWLLGATFHETTNSVFDTTDQSKSFSITIPRYYTSRGGVEALFKLRELLKQREESDIELHVEEVRKRGN